MTDLIETYMPQVSIIDQRIIALKNELLTTTGNLSRANLERRIETLTFEKCDLQDTIGEMKKHL